MQGVLVLVEGVTMRYVGSLQDEKALNAKNPYAGRIDERPRPQTTTTDHDQRSKSYEVSINAELSDFGLCFLFARSVLRRMMASKARRAGHDDILISQHQQRPGPRNACGT